MSVVSRLTVARAESRRAARQQFADLVAKDAAKQLEAAEVDRLAELAKAGGITDAEVDALEPYVRGGVKAQATAVARATADGLPHYVLNPQEQAASAQHIDAARAFVEA